ncbi:MAG: hypothetical protein ACM3W7_01190 [Acidobacteriota bacterium]
MSTLMFRPKRGLAPAKALARWSDPALYAELVRLAGTDNLPPTNLCGNVIRDPAREKEYQIKRRSLEDAFRVLLQNDVVRSSAIPEYGEAREILNPSVWDLLWVDYEFEEAVGKGRTYFALEFFERTEIPQNVKSIPAWLDTELAAAGMNVFRHTQAYRHVMLHGLEFALSELHAKIVKILHKAFLDDPHDAWRRGVDVLEEAGSIQLKMSDVFKSREDWKLLIESDGKGMYRLKMEAPVTPP